MNGLPRKLRGFILLVIAGTAFSLAAQAPVRVANTSLKMPLNPPQLGFRTTNAFSPLTFSQPLGILSPPGETNRVFILEKTGQVIVITNLAAPNKTVFLDLTPRGLQTGSECGLLGMAFHPGYATNRQFFVFYSVAGYATAAGSGLHQRLSRFETAATNANAASLESEKFLMNQFDQADNHNGGDIHFGPDGNLYVSVGDEGGGDDTFNNGQRIDRNFFAGILRLDVDERPGSVAPNAHPALGGTNMVTYRVPADNPWIGATNFNGSAVNPALVRTEFYAVGLRNAWRMSFDPLTGLLYSGDVGQGAWEEIAVIRRGDNHGWAFREGLVAGPRSRPAGAVAVDPIHVYPHGSSGTNVGNSVTGGIVYRGERLSQLTGDYIFADYTAPGNIWAFRYDGTNVTRHRQLLQDGGIAGFGRDPRNGDVLLADINAGTVKRLEYNSTTNGVPLPPTLADTGAFANLATLEPAAGVWPYAVNHPFWSDNAGKRRWFSLPNVGLTFGFEPTNAWRFPTGTVWVKHFDLVTNEVSGESRRIETRFLMKQGGGVYGVTYRWAPGATNAALVAEAGAEDLIAITEAGGGVRTQRWIYPSRASCLSCHTPQAGWALGFGTAQLNGDLTYADGWRTNQLHALAEAGYFNSPLSTPSLLPRTTAVTNATVSLEARVRSYLEVNCSFCHQPGGSAPGNWDGRLATPTDLAGIIDGLLGNTGTNAANRVIVPRRVDLSMIHQRIGLRGAGQMPPLASTVVDTNAVELIRQWIESDELRARAGFASWQELHFGNAGLPQAASGADADGDGANNLAEFRAGTNPTNAASVAGIAFDRSGTNGVLRFQQPANRSALIETSAGLGVSALWWPWSEGGVPEFPIAPIERQFPVTSLQSTQQFFRVRLGAP